MEYIAHFEKYKFNPETNGMESEVVELETNINYKNCKLFRAYFWSSLIKYFVAALSVLGLALALGATSDDINIGVISGCIFFAVVFILGLFNSINGYSFELSNKDKKEWFSKNEESYRQLELDNFNELNICEEWRRTHPFEEKIRKALESKNSNDVAEAIKMILDKDINEG